MVRPLDFDRLSPGGFRQPLSPIDFRDLWSWGKRNQRRRI